MDPADFLDSARKVAFSAPIPPGGIVCFVDSSFNPPNNAHVKLAELCRQRFPGCTLVLMLSTGNADKPAVPANELHERVEMMKTVAENELGGNVRLALTTEARFIDKAVAVGDALPGSRAVFAMGFDTLVRLGDQKYYDQPVSEVLAAFFANVDVLVLTREQDRVSKMPELGPIREQEELASAGCLQPFRAKIHTVISASDTQEVSSSRARSSVAELERTSPPSIVEYVRTHKLYGLF